MMGIQINLQRIELGNLLGEQVTKAERASKTRCCSFFPYNVCDICDMIWEGSVVISVKVLTKYNQDKRQMECKVIFSSQMDGSWAVGGLATKTCGKTLL